MKKFVIFLTCMLLCLALLAGCKDKKNSNQQDLDVGNSVEVDVSGIGDVDTEISTDTNTLPDGFDYTFKDPDNSDGIVVTPRG